MSRSVEAPAQLSSVSLPVLQSSSKTVHSSETVARGAARIRIQLDGFQQFVCHVYHISCYFGISHAFGNPCLHGEVFVAIPCTRAPGHRMLRSVSDEVIASSTALHACSPPSRARAFSWLRNGTRRWYSLRDVTSRSEYQMLPYDSIRRTTIRF